MARRARGYVLAACGVLGEVVFIEGFHVCSLVAGWQPASAVFLLGSGLYSGSRTCSELTRHGRRTRRVFRRGSSAGAPLRVFRCGSFVLPFFLLVEDRFLGRSSGEVKFILCEGIVSGVFR